MRSTRRDALGWFSRSLEARDAAKASLPSCDVDETRLQEVEEAEKKKERRSGTIRVGASLVGFCLDPADLRNDSEENTEAGDRTVARSVEKKSCVLSRRCRERKEEEESRVNSRGQQLSSISSSLCLEGRRRLLFARSSYEFRSPRVTEVASSTL